MRRIRSIAALLCAGIACLMVGASAPAANASTACSVLIINDGGSHTSDLVTSLRNAGDSVTTTSATSGSYNGSNPSPNGFGTVIELDGLTYTQDMPASGQTALSNYVNNGGGFIGAEWLAYQFGNRQYQQMRDLILFDRVNGREGTGIGMSVVAAQAAHPVLAGVPSTFSFGGGVNVGPVHTFATNPASVLMTDDINSAAVAARTFGAGRVVGFHNAGNYGTYATLTNSNIQRLYANAATWTCGKDTTPPVITHAVSPAPNASGWNNSNVTVTFTVTDPDSGIASSNGCGAQTISADTAGTTFTCTAADPSGNTASDSVTVKLDKTAPTITGSRTPAANGAGWNNSDVTVSFSCSDALSGVATCSGPTTLSSEGAGQSVSGSSTDKAGNTASSTVNVNIDKTAPVTTTTPTTLVVRAAGQTISGTALDNLSGVASTSVTLTPILPGTPVTLTATCTGCGTTTTTWSLTVPDSVTPGPYMVTAASTDVAGNPETAAAPITVVII